MSLLMHGTRMVLQYRTDNICLQQIWTCSCRSVTQVVLRYLLVAHLLCTNPELVIPYCQIKYLIIRYLAIESVRPSTGCPGTCTVNRKTCAGVILRFLVKKSEKLLKFYPIYVSIVRDVVSGRIQYRWHGTVHEDYLSQKDKQHNKQSGFQPSYNSLATHHGLRPSHSPRLSHDGHDGYGCARGASLEQSFSIVRPVLQVPDVVLARGHP